MREIYILILFIILFIVLVVLYPFKITWRFHINLLENIGFLVFKVLFIRLTVERFKISNDFKIEKEKEKESKKDKTFFHNYILSLAKRVNAKKIDFFSDVGAKDDAYFVSVFSGYLGVCLSSIFCLILNRYSLVKIFNYFVPNYREPRLEFTGKIIVTFNLISVLISLFEAYKLTKKIKK